MHNDCGAVPDNEDFTMANKGHSRGARTEPNNLKEYYAMQETIFNPLDGTILTDVQMTDLRWPSTEGWVKMQRTYKFFGDKKCTIHYVLNKSLKLMDDFKFVFPK